MTQKAIWLWLDCLLICLSIGYGFYFRHLFFHFLGGRKRFHLRIQKHSLLFDAEGRLFECVLFLCFLFFFCWFCFSLTGFDEDTYLRSIVPMMRLTHCVRPPLANLYRERMVLCPVRYNTAGAP